MQTRRSEVSTFPNPSHIFLPPLTDSPTASLWMRAACIADVTQIPLNYAYYCKQITSYPTQWLSIVFTLPEKYFNIRFNFCFLSLTLQDCLWRYQLSIICHTEWLSTTKNVIGVACGPRVENHWRRWTLEVACVTKDVAHGARDPFACNSFFTVHYQSKWKWVESFSG